mmetsp:Transcript_24817/g.68719  ORF Transcript_24817/g.68719 Transcript_24817/m.68719 type:complete len:420 (+) Transcript_24817:66-1325(+)|eukprot:CAMPEP_0168736166 /NCGR_PEP_ID=MMETSP0724-20121128/9722_1 /TAXON_ID=265536 /ORGANISM="Amphiprora sp., Strain CCMP467" /LENGTH=419 /DNA_ID=CAMNT_0008783359 /DNA_START=35 /DNA_END=1294 /DNA_ORIENTATION=+
MGSAKERNPKVKNDRKRGGGASLSSFIEQESSVTSAIDRALQEVRALLDLQRMKDELQDAVGGDDNDLNSNNPKESRRSLAETDGDGQGQSDDEDDWTAGERTMSSYAGTNVSILSELRGLEGESERLQSHITQAEAEWKVSERSAIESLVAETAVAASPKNSLSATVVRNEGSQSITATSASASQTSTSQRGPQEERLQAAATALNELSGLIGGSIGDIQSSKNHFQNIHTIYTIKSDDGNDNYTLSDGTLGGVTLPEDDDDEDDDDDDEESSYESDNDTISDMLSLAESLDTFVTHLSKQKRVDSRTAESCYSATLRFRLATYALACGVFKSDVFRILPYFLQQRYRKEQEEEEDQRRRSGPITYHDALRSHSQMMLGVPLFGSMSICNGERMVFMNHQQQPRRSQEEEGELEDLYE